MTRILIGTPVKESLPSGYVKSVADMIARNKDIEFDLRLEYGALYDARDRLCRYTLDEDFDYLLCIDSDQTFPADAIEKLISHQVDIITGVYVDKHSQHKPLLFSELHPRDNDKAPYAKRKDLDLSKELITVAGCGAGFMLVSNHALRLIKIHKRGWFEPYGGLGEDVSFCQRAREVGLKIYCDTTIKDIGHIKTVTYTIKDWSGVLDE